LPRARRVSTDDILDAAERVVARLGTAGLSIDAVAQEAGVSKSMVVYDHKSKSALLEALVARYVKGEMGRVQKAVTASAKTPHPELFGRIAVAEQDQNDAERAVAVSVCTAMSSEKQFQQQMRDWTLMDLGAMAGGVRPKAALMAYLALSGFYFTEFFGFHVWSAAERAEILDGIRTIYASYPDGK
jgi:AcrR family transcriptional regulator